MIVANGTAPSSQALAILRSARHRLCACRCPMLEKKSCSPASASSASVAAPGAADGHDSASRLKHAMASCRVVASGDRSKPLMPGANTPATAPASDASEAFAASAARSAAVDMPATGSKSSASTASVGALALRSPESSSPSFSSPSSSSSTSSSTSASTSSSSSSSSSSTTFTSPDMEPERTAASRNLPSAAAAACRRAISAPRSS